MKVLYTMGQDTPRIHCGVVRLIGNWGWWTNRRPRKRRG